MSATVLDLDAPELAAPLHPAASPDELALLAWAAANEIPRPTPPMSQGRYRLPHPVSGKVRSWTRMSTLAKTLDDTAGLDIWRARLLVAGLVAHPEFLDDADPDNKTSLTAVANRAALHGGDKLKADLGTAMHTALEHLVLDTGLLPPAPWLDDVLAMADAFEQAGLTFPKELVEATLIAPELDAVGRTDLVAAGPWGEPLRIADLKTGTIQHIPAAAQLAGYAKATHRWTPDGYEPFTGIDQAIGLLIHAPLGTGTCTIYELDLITGAEIVDLALVVRKRRNGAKKLATELVTTAIETSDVPADTNTEPAGNPVVVADVLPEAVNDMRAQAIKGRLKAISADDREALVRGWPDGTPHKPPWTFDQATGLEAHLYTFDGIETPFILDPDGPDPVAEREAERAAAEAERAAATLTSAGAPTWPTPHPGVIVPHNEAAAVRTAAKNLDADQKATAAAWGADAKRLHRPWGTVVAGQMTERTLAINLAALRCLLAFGTNETKTRTAIACGLGEDVQPSWQTGAIFGSLTTDQANEIEDIAARYLAGDTTTRAVIDGTE